MLPPEERHGESLLAAAGLCCGVKIVRVDGQLVLTLTYLKRASTYAYRDVVIANGNFHTSGHFAFAVNEGFHDSKFGCSKSLLHINKVPKHIENFENDTYTPPLR